MEENVFIGNVFFALVGAIMAILGIVKCCRQGRVWLYYTVVGVVVVLAMIFDKGHFTYNDCLLWLMCIASFVMWFAVKACRKGVLPLVPLVPLVLALLVIIWSPLWWIGVIGGIVVNAILAYAVNEYTKFKEEFLDLGEDDF